MNFTLQLYKFYDIAGPLSTFKIVRNIKEFNTENLEQYDLSSNIKEPEFVSFPRPISFEYTEKNYKWKDQKLKITCKLYNYGALSIYTTINLEIEDFSQINKYIKKEDPVPQLEEKLDQVSREIINKFNSDSKNSYPETNYTNLYPVFCISNTEQEDVKKIIDNNKQNITSLLSGMEDHIKKIDTFSSIQVDSILKNKIRFFKKDYSIIHWYGALTIDNEGDYSDVLFTIELAHIQFIKLRAYDQYIDNYLNEYLSSIKNTFKYHLPHLILGVRQRMREITQIRIEIEKITEIMDNFEKFYGSWYLAKIYYLASQAFEIPRWKQLLFSRMETINELYTMLQEESNRIKMLSLNFLTFLLFVLWFITA